MAIDTTDKRRSVSGIPMTPDADLDDAQDRMHIAGFYRGISPSAPEVIIKKLKGMLLGVYQ